ncbi:MAG: 5-formyltetrahydrofolate cyclo-ligase [Nocardiopsaceae bacterium]|nr:5-formyltetrahydrofolate cyclo-ligase [Nocardiopsaceae bacterium]
MRYRVAGVAVTERPSPGVQAEKAALRKRLLANRSTITTDLHNGYSRLLRDHLLELPQVGAAGTVAVYYSVGSEPSTRSLVYALWKQGHYVVLPVLLSDGDLDWASYEGPDSMVPGPRGLLEPSEPRRGVETVSRADVVIVPALAVSRAGMRLGRGGGSYDRALARVGERVPTIALLYDDELLPSVPAAPHDLPVRAVATPGRGITWLPALLSLAVGRYEC